MVAGDESRSAGRARRQWQQPAMGAASNKRRKAAVEKTEEMVGRLQSAAEAEAAATGTMAQRVLVAGATEEDRARRLPNGLEEESKSGRRLVAGAADEIMARRSLEEIVQAAIVRAASRMGTEAEGGDVRQAAEVVVVETMQVSSIEAARAEVADAVDATMGWGQQRQ